MFRVNILLPDRTVYDNDAASLVVPAEFSFLGVLAHHAPIVARLVPGKITLRDPFDKPASFVLNSGGILEVSDNKATLLIDSLELPA